MDAWIWIEFEPLRSRCTWALWPFVPHNLISVQESPVPLPKFQMAPRFKILMFSGSKKGTQIYYPFYSKSPGKRKNRWIFFRLAEQVDGFILKHVLFI